MRIDERCGITFSFIYLFFRNEKSPEYCTCVFGRRLLAAADASPHRWTLSILYWPLKVAPCPPPWHSRSAWCCQVVKAGAVRQLPQFCWTRTCLSPSLSLFISDSLTRTCIHTGGVSRLYFSNVALDLESSSEHSELFRLRDLSGMTF